MMKEGIPIRRLSGGEERLLAERLKMSVGELRQLVFEVETECAARDLEAEAAQLRSKL